MYLYLDESGDLGFDFENSNPSHFFVITLLSILDAKSIKMINAAISRTLDKKLNHKKKRHRIISELKGNATNLEVKKYFLNCINRHTNDWSLHAIFLNKKSLLKQTKNPPKDRIYNQMTHQLLENINFPKTNCVTLIIDRSKDTLGIQEFNEYLRTNLSLCLNLETKLYIHHDSSEKHKGIQAVDMFCYGISRKYEREDQAWYELFKEKIAVECEFKG
jgi:hypothetical protein